MFVLQVPVDLDSPSAWVRCSMVLDAMMLLALVMVASVLYESVNAKSHSVSEKSWF